jgi:WD40 repeat protein
MANGKDSSAEQAKPLARRAALGGVGAAVLAGPSPGQAQSRPAGGGMSGGGATPALVPSAPGSLRLELVARLDQVTSATDMAWSPDGSRLAVVNGAWFSTRVLIFDTTSWRLVTTILRGNDYGKPTLGFAANGRELVTGLAGLSVPLEYRDYRNNPFVFGVFDTETGQLLRRARWPEGFSFGETTTTRLIRVSPDGRYAVVTGGIRRERFLHLYDVARAEFLRAMETPRRARFEAPDIDRSNRLAVSAVYTDRGSDTAGPAVRKGIEVFQLPSLQRVLSLEGHLPNVASMAWSPTGDRLLSGAFGVRSATDPETGRLREYRDPDPIRIWDGRSGAMITSFPGPIEPVTWLSWHPSGEIFASASAKGTGEYERTGQPGTLIQILPARGGAPLLQHFGREREILDLPCFCPRTGRLAWSAEQGVMIHKLVNA